MANILYTAKSTKIFKIAVFVILIFNTCLLNTAESKEYMKKTIAIDLDGVLDNYTKYTDDIPPIKHGAKEFIIKLSKDYELVLFTTRSPKEATMWLISNKIDKYFKDVTNVKLPAYIYLDDRSIQFQGDYNKTLGEIEKFKVYWKEN